MQNEALLALNNLKIYLMVIFMGKLNVMVDNIPIIDAVIL